jgi:hypothetical protein
MKIDYSSHKEFKNAYYFYPSEKQTICNSLIDYNKKLLIKIERINNSSKNEGQLIYLEKVRLLRAEIKNNLDIINILS